MNRQLTGLLAVMLLLVLAACSSPTPAPLPEPTAVAVPTQPSAPNPTKPAATAPTVAPTSVAKPTTPATPVKAALTCPPAAALPANAQLAARVNGQGISLDLYNRQMNQAQVALVQNGGLDPKSAQGIEAIKSLKQQVLDQMIDEVVIAQQANREGIKVTDEQANAQLAQMIQDAGTVDKLNEYLTKNQLTLADLCGQIRGNILGDAMLQRVTGALPTNVPQVRVRHILVKTAQEATALREQIRQGKDFGEIAKVSSLDEATKANGGDLGWLPKGVMDPQFEAVAFQLRAGEVSSVVQTQFGFHIIKVEEKADSRALPPEVLQRARQQAFLAWLQAVRDTLKIERLVAP
ncbi:MAG: peptidylprolyl isomerase [Chloroflexi bacterium]|nr:peptidylprolyl isomerase [Chloroflexota bacterium]